MTDVMMNKFSKENLLSSVSEKLTTKTSEVFHRKMKPKTEAIQKWPADDDATLSVNKEVVAE